MIVRVWSGSILFVLVILPQNGPFATGLDGNTSSAATGQPSNTSVLNQSNDTFAPFVSSFNKTGITLENETVPETGEGEGRTDPNVRDDSDNRTEEKDPTEGNVKSSNATDSDVRHGYTRNSGEVRTSTAFLITSAILRQQDHETSHDESTSAADQNLTGSHRKQQTNYSSIALDSPSASFKKNYTGRTTSSRADTGSSAENVLENENTQSSRKAAGTAEATSIMADPAGKLMKRTSSDHHVLLSTAALVVDPATPDFKTESKLDQTFGRSTEGQMTQTDDVRNWKRDVNVTRLDVTKSELAYKSLWDDADTEDDEGKMEADGGGGRGGTSRKEIAGGATEPRGSGKRTDGKRDDDGRFTIPAELRRARNRNEHFSLSFHGLPWREELNILVPVLCGMFGAMILVLAAYFLRNCPNNIRRLARMSRPSKLHRRKSDLNLLIDNSSGDENP